VPKVGSLHALKRGEVGRDRRAGGAACAAGGGECDLLRAGEEDQVDAVQEPRSKLGLNIGAPAVRASLGKGLRTPQLEAVFLR
jgi:hypothetical protein